MNTATEINKIKIEISSKPIWEEAAEEFASAFAHGDTVTHDWLYQKLGLTRPSPKTTFSEGQRIQLKFLTLFDRMKQLLCTRYNMVLKPKDGYGYEVVLPEHQTDYAEKDGVRKIAKALDECSNRLEHIEVSRLDTAQIMRNTEARTRIAAISDMFHRINRRRRPAEH